MALQVIFVSEATESRVHRAFGIALRKAAQSRWLFPQPAAFGWASCFWLKPKPRKSREKPNQAHPNLYTFLSLEILENSFKM
jgi:hypothetical protein